MTTPQQPGQPGGAGQPFGQQPYGQQPPTGQQPFANQQQFGQQPAGSFGGQPAGGQPAFNAAGGAPAGNAEAGGATPGYQGPGFPQAGAPQQGGFGPAQGGGGGFGPAMPPLGRRGRGRGRISRKVRYIRLGISLVVIIVAAVVALISSHSDPQNAKAGDCIGNLPSDTNSSAAVDANDAKKVDCTDPSAAYKVLGVYDDSTGNDINDQDKIQKDCAQWPNFDSAFEESQEDNSGNATSGTVLCLQQIKH